MTTKEPLDFTGTYRMRNGEFVEVLKGIIPGPDAGGFSRTFFYEKTESHKAKSWDSNGNNLENREFDLMERKNPQVM